MKLTQLFKEFFESEKSGGMTLIVCAALSLILANTPLSDSYIGLWNTYIGGYSLAHWINDGLMAIFFLLVGLELEREVYVGEMSNFRDASLPLFSALGGMMMPAGIFLLFNYGLVTQDGVGIPTATDIAFAIGILSLLGNRVPASLKVLLTAMAVIDDLGAIIVIALFYTTSLSMVNLGIALGIFALLLVLNRMKVHSLIPYLLGGAAMWYFMLNSGVHATITGVLLAFAIPFGNGDKNSPSYGLQHNLHIPVAFGILPIFALANTAIPIAGDWYTSLTQSNSLGIMLGLLIGKPIGATLFSFIAVMIGVATLPKTINWKHVIGVGFLAGIGFTMAIFITVLAYDDAELVNNSKIAVLVGSLIAATIGYVWLRMTLPSPIPEEVVIEMHSC
ncbi:MAG TPA: Na+/H+ antiporter NhaA [Patescibacteria group bacterium]|nr:Na+/H+ antiporter NhaA [Patescibacteria group bacterium]